jgi:hypothetical protein
MLLIFLTTQTYPISGVANQIVRQDVWTMPFIMIVMLTHNALVALNLRRPDFVDRYHGCPDNGCPDNGRRQKVTIA